MRFQILALSGGGYLGLFSAYILAQLEEQAGQPLARHFDLVCGTSIGGILALGLANEVPAADMLEAFSKRGKAIFSERPRPRSKWEARRDMLRYIWGPKYRSDELRKTVEEFLGRDTLLGAAKHPVIIPAVNMTKGSIQMFKTAHHETFIRDPRLRMVDIALATSAAPTYFPMAEIGDSLFVDGGLFANAPDLCGVHEAVHFLNADPAEVHVLSIGTTGTSFSLAHSTGQDFGLFQWAMESRLISTMFSAQQQLADNLLRHQLGDRYFRIDRTQSQEQSRDLALDVATDDAQKTIRGMAEGAYQEASAKLALREMLNHRAAEPVFYPGPA